MLVLLAATARPSTAASDTPATATTIAPVDHGLKVVIAGHSFHARIAEPLATLAHGAGYPDHATVGYQFLGGSQVIQVWNIPDATNKAKQALSAGNVDVLTLSPNRLMPDPGIDHFVDFALKHNPGIRVTVQMSWMPYAPLDSSVKGNPPTPEGEAITGPQVAALHAEYYDQLRDQARAINTRCGRPVVFCVPTGPALFALREKVRLGQVPLIKTQASLFADRLGHPAPAVALLNTYCHFAVIYRRSPVGLHSDSLTKGLKAPAEALAATDRLLQELAWEAVRAEPLSGVTGP